MCPRIREVLPGRHRWIHRRGAVQGRFLSLITYFETLVKRGTLRKAKQVYKQAADLLAQAGTGSHEQMRQVWRQLLGQIEAESLKEYQIREVRQYVCRHWNMPAARLPFGVVS